MQKRICDKSCQPTRASVNGAGTVAGYLSLDECTKEEVMGSDAYPKIFYVSLPQDIPTTARIQVTAPWGEHFIISLLGNKPLFKGQELKICIPDPSSGKTPTASAFTQEVAMSGYANERPKVFKTISKLDGKGACSPEDDASTVSQFLPPELVKKFHDEQYREDVRDGTHSELCIVGPGGVERRISFKGLSAEQKALAAAQAVKTIGMECAPPGMDMTGVNLTAEHVDFPESMSYEDKTLAARKLVSSRSVRSSTRSAVGKVESVTDHTIDFTEKDFATSSKDEDTLPKGTAKETQGAQDATQETMAGRAFLRLCGATGISTDCDFALAAEEQLATALMGLKEGDKIASAVLEREVRRLVECLRLGLGADADPTTINNAKELRAQKMADALLEEEAEEQAASKAKASKKSAKKKAAKERKVAKVAVSLTSIQEDEPVLEEQPVEQPEPPSEGPPPPIELPPAFMDLSDLKSSLVEKNDDAATSVATALQCVVCMKNERAVACVPCGHRCLCEDCGKTSAIRDKRCPMCRAEIKMFMRVFD